MKKATKHLTTFAPHLDRFCTAQIASVNASFDSRFRPFSSADYRRDVHDGVVMCQAASDGGIIHSRKVKLKAGQIWGSLAFPDLGANPGYFFLIFYFYFLSLYL
jgi:hypothetical protein